LDAADLLAKEGLSPRVVSIATLKPIDKEAILAAARETGAIVTVEEHSILGGLGAAVSEIVTDQHPCPVKRVGIPDTFADTGPYEELLDMFGLSVDNIVKAAKDALAMKKANS
jgi:transketolase